MLFGDSASVGVASGAPSSPVLVCVSAGSLAFGAEVASSLLVALPRSSFVASAWASGSGFGSAFGLASRAPFGPAFASVPGAGASPLGCSGFGFSLWFASRLSAARFLRRLRVLRRSWLPRCVWGASFLRLVVCAGLGLRVSVFPSSGVSSSFRVVG